MFSNKIKPVKLLAHIGLIFFLFLVTYHFYMGITNPVPAPGDSTTYHIPISLAILDGTFINPKAYTQDTFMAQLNPGSSEAINSLFILLQIPLTISNLFAIIVLFFFCFALGRTFKLDYYWSLFFAETICTLTVIARWFNSVSVDVWLAVFFIMAIILLEKPKKTYKYALLFGFALGMMIGTKYTALGFVLVLVLIYIQTIFRIFSIKRFLVFLIPFSIFGIFWYVRNYLALGNPIWPLCLFTLPCQGHWYNDHLQMWDTTLIYPLTMFNAFYSEFKLWGLSLFTIVFVLFMKYKLKKTIPPKVLLLCIIGLCNFILFLPTPTSQQPWIMVSSFRYSYPVFIPLILSVFILAKYYKKEVLLGYLSFASMLPVLSFMYLPKLLLIYFPLSLLCFYLLERFEPKSERL